MSEGLLIRLVEQGGIGAITIGFIFILSKIIDKFVKPKTQNGTDRAILKEVETMNVNHLHSIEEAVRNGNDKVIDAINRSANMQQEYSIKMVELLGEIKGGLKK